LISIVKVPPLLPSIVEGTGKGFINCGCVLGFNNPCVFAFGQIKKNMKKTQPINWSSKLPHKHKF
jgi:hypothetical protein